MPDTDIPDTEDQRHLRLVQHECDTLEQAAEASQEAVEHVKTLQESEGDEEAFFQAADRLEASLERMDMALHHVNLDHVDRLVAEATPGPWCLFGNGDLTISVMPAGRSGDVAVFNNHDTIVKRADAQLMAQAPELLRKMAYELRRLRERQPIEAADTEPPNEPQ